MSFDCEVYFIIFFIMNLWMNFVTLRFHLPFVWRTDKLLGCHKNVYLCSKKCMQSEQMRKTHKMNSCIAHYILFYIYNKIFYYFFSYQSDRKLDNSMVFANIAYHHTIDHRLLDIGCILGFKWNTGQNDSQTSNVHCPYF